MIYKTPIFYQWDSVWRRNDSSIIDLLDKANSIAEIRNEGNSKLPIWPHNRNDWLSKNLIQFKKIYDSCSEPQSKKYDVFYKTYAENIINLNRYIKIIKWPRRIYLEHALSYAINKSNFLLCALALRTLIEELVLLKSLKNYEEKIPNSIEKRKSDHSEEDCINIRNYSLLLFKRLFPNFTKPSDEEIISGHNLKDFLYQLPTILVEKFRELNDYVHPNYGSHVVTIWPEKSNVGKIILSSFINIYECFFNLNIDKPSCDKHESIKNIDDTLEFDYLLNTTIPQISNNYKINEDVDNQDYFKKIIKNKLAYESEAFVSEYEGCDILKDYLLPLCNQLSNEEILRTTNEILDYPKLHPEFGMPQYRADWTRLGSIRKIADDIDSLTSGIEWNKFVFDYNTWILFIKKNIEFSLLVSTFKTNSLFISALDMLNQRNPLGLILCVRSIIENHTISIFMGKRFKKAYTIIENSSRSSQGIENQLDEIEKELARFLAGTMNTSEKANQCRSRWEKSGKSKPINITTPIKEYFAERMDSNKANIYDVYSKVIHGFLLKGGDLLLQGGSPIIENELEKAVLFLRKFYGYDAISEIYQDFTLVALKFQNLIEKKENIQGVDSLENEINKQSISGRKIKHGRDIFGNGTKGNPFQFKTDINYYEALNAYCKQENMNSNIIITHIYKDGIKGDIVKDKNNNDIYFINSKGFMWD